MIIVTDRGADLSPDQLMDLDIHFLPLRIALEGKTYLGGEELSSEEFYHLLENTNEFPTTSQPAPGEFADLYRELGKKDPEILSIHISSGLSGTLESAKLGAAMVPEVKVLFHDTKTLSCPEGWQVEAAARAVKLGWTAEKIVNYLSQIREKAEGMFTLNELRYLIHGGRIGHIKGLVASLLNIKPVIGVDHQTGKYINPAQDVTLKRAIRRMVEIATKFYDEGTRLRVQPLHGNNFPGVEFMMETLKRNHDCVFEPITSIAPVLGAHTGPSLVGLAIAPLSLFDPIRE